MKAASRTLSIFAAVAMLVMIAASPALTAGVGNTFGRGAFAQGSSDMLTYANSKAGLSMQYPADWDLEDLGGNYVVFHSPYEGDDDGYSEFVGVFTEVFSSSPSLDSYVDRYIGEIRAILPDLEVIDDKPATISGLPARTVLTSDTDLDGDGNPDHSTMRTFVVDGQRAYVIIYDALQDAYDSYLSVVTEMQDSVSIDTAGLARPATGAQLLTYQNDTIGVKLQYPDNWDKVVPPDDDSLTYFYPPYDNDMDPVSDHAVVAYEDVPSGTSLSEYTASTITLLSSDDDSFKMIESKDLLIAGHLGHRITFTSDSPSYGPMKLTVAWTLAGNRAFVLSLVAEESAYGDYLSAYEKMLGSLQVTPKEGSATGSSGPPQNPGELVPYDNAIHAFRISYPDNWAKTNPEGGEGLVTGEIVTFASPTGDAFVTVSIEDLLLRPMTEQEYTDATIDSLKGSVSLFRQEESTPVELDGNPGHKLVFSGLYTVFGDTAVSIKAMTQWAIIGEGRAYVITYLALPGAYDMYLPMADKMVSTVEIDSDQVPRRISGTLESAKIGISMELPEGWAGIEGNSALLERIPFNSFIVVFPELERVSQSYNMSTDDINATAYAKDLFGSVMVVASMNVDDLIHGKLTGHAANETGHCESSGSASIVTINGVKALKTQGRCSGLLIGNDYQYGAYGIFTPENVIYVALYQSGTNQDQLAKFESAVQTITAENAVDLADYMAMASLKGHSEIKNQTVFVDENPYQLRMLSNSTVSEFGLDEGKKQISFKVEGVPNTIGEVDLELGAVLKGPYIVTVDGSVIDNTFTVDDSDTGKSFVSFTYPHSVHQITISGTNVVPEFGGLVFAIVALGMIATMIVVRVSSKSEHQPMK